MSESSSEDNKTHPTPLFQLRRRLTMDSFQLAHFAFKAQQFATSVGTDPIHRDPESGEPAVSGSESDGVIKKLHWTGIGIVCAAAIIFGLLSWILVNWWLVDLSSGLVMFFGVGVLYQRHVLQLLGGFRGQHNALRKSVNTVRVENDRLSKTVDRLTEHNSK